MPRWQRFTWNMGWLVALSDADAGVLQSLIEAAVTVSTQGQASESSADPTLQPLVEAADAFLMRCWAHVGLSPTDRLGAEDGE